MMGQARSDYGTFQAELGRIRAARSRLGIKSWLRTANLFSAAGKLLLALCLLVSIASARQVQDAGGNVAVNVVVRDSARAVSSVASVGVRLKGPTVAQGETDENGNCPFSNVRPGKYVIEVSSPGFEGSRSAFVKPGETLEIELEMSPAEVKSSVTVTADTPEGKQASPSTTMNDKVLETARERAATDSGSRSRARWTYQSQRHSQHRAVRW
jgi:Carboxypeptidase regulatory-like domain